MEVLDATKHQDDKVGRFLTAVAFLTGGAIALATRAEVFSIRYRLDGRELHLPTYLLMVFFGLVLVSALFLVFSIGSPLSFPLRARRPSSADGSLIFFIQIANYGQREWLERWEAAPRELRERLSHDYVNEAHNLAWRAKAKYFRSDFARALLAVALVALALATGLTFLAFATTSVSPARLSWSLSRRILVSVALGLFCLAIAGDHFRFRQAYRDFVSGGEDDQRIASVWKELRYLSVLLPAAVAFPVLLILPSDRVSLGWWGAMLALAAVTAVHSVVAQKQSQSVPFWFGLAWGAGGLVALGLQSATAEFAAGGSLVLPLVALQAARKSDKHDARSDDSAGGAIAKGLGDVRRR